MFTENIIMNKFEILIFDSCTELVGHGRHYNRSLKNAVIENGFSARLMEGVRTKLFWQYTKLLKLLFKATNLRKVFFPTPSFVEYLILYFVSFIFYKKKFYIFVRRLDSNQFKRTFKIFIYKQMFKRNNLILLVDNTEIAKTLNLLNKSFHLPIPPRVLSESVEGEVKEFKSFFSKFEQTFGFLGRLHLEKGADYYEELIQHILKFNGSGVFLQIAFDKNDHAVKKIANELLNRYEENKRVFIHLGKLPDAEYEAVLKYCDIGVIPYKTELYGLGTSGVAAEFIMSGKTVFCTRLGWLENHPYLRASCVFFDLNRTDKISKNIKRLLASLKTKKNKTQYDAKWLSAVKQVLLERS